MSFCSTSPPTSASRYRGKNKGEILLEFSNYVVGRGTNHLTTVLIVDEAHHLSEDILEEIRLLTNLETSYGKLLQILLVGQPELDDKLDSPELRQLKQRVAHRARLAPLDASETRGYIAKRLEIAGANPNGHFLFPEDAIARVFQHSHGIPRLINTICENALITAYARRLRSVTPEIIDNTAADLRLDVAHLPQAESPTGVRRNLCPASLQDPAGVVCLSEESVATRRGTRTALRSGFDPHEPNL